MLGLLVTLAFFLWGRSFFSFFFSDPESQKLGAMYLYILAVSQVFMIYEITTRGAFNGIGQTVPPSVTGIVFTALRIPLSWALLAFSTWGLLGIWGAISFTSLLKGTVLPLWFWLVLRKNLRAVAHRKL